MKYIFCSLFYIVFFVEVYSQPKIVDFLSAMIAVPVDKKVSITDVIYRDGKFDTIEKQIVKGVKFKHSCRNNEIGTIVDEAQLVNYKSDTLYIISTTYIPNTSTSTIIKTRKGAFDFIYSVDKECNIRPLENSYINTPEDEKESDFLLYEAIFTWDIDLLIRIIKSSGSLLGSEYVMSATRIIIKDNQVLEKDIINFEPALRWHLPN